MFRTIRSHILEVGLDGPQVVVSLFFESMDGLGQVEVGPDAVSGPEGPCGAPLLHLFFRLPQRKDDPRRVKSGEKEIKAKQLTVRSIAHSRCRETLLV